MLPALLLLLQTSAGSPPAVPDARPDPVQDTPATPQSLPQPRPLAERFGGLPGHAFLVVDVTDGRVLRADDAESCEEEAVAWGRGGRYLAALAGLEDGTVDPERIVECDSTCWANATHGPVSLVTGLAWECDTWFATLDVDSARVRDTVSALGLVTDDGREAATLRQWTDFWRTLTGGGSGLRATTISSLQAAAGTAVTSPRGTARTLNDPRFAIRAIPGTGDDGAWVAGVAWVPGGRRWAFALHLRDGGLALATARANHLLDETLRAYRHSARERGGEPWPGWVDP